MHPAYLLRQHSDAVAALNKFVIARAAEAASVPEPPNEALPATDANSTPSLVNKARKCGEKRNAD